LSYSLKPHYCVFIRLDTIWEHDGETDRRTDGIPFAITALCIVSNADAL